MLDKLIKISKLIPTTLLLLSTHRTTSNVYENSEKHRQERVTELLTLWVEERRLTAKYEVISFVYDLSSVCTESG